MPDCSAAPFPGARRWLNPSALLPLLVGACQAGAPPAGSDVDGLAAAAAPGRMAYETTVAFDPAAGSLEARARIALAPSVGADGHVAFLLNGGLDVHEVAGPHVIGHRLDPFEGVPTWNVLTVELAPDRPADEPLRLDVGYAGRLGEDPDTSPISERVIELNADNMWHPLALTAEQGVTGVLYVDLPAHWEIVGSGILEEDAGPGARPLRRLVTATPSVDVAFSASPHFARARAPGATVHHLGDAHVAAEAVAEVASRCAAHLNERYGRSARLPEVRLVLLERPGHGYARADYIVLSQVDPDDEPGLVRFVCHELAHFWTPSPGAMSPDYWMMETFAEYAMGLAAAELLGPADFDAIVAGWRRRGEGSGPVWTPEMTGRSGPAAMYALGPALLERLRGRIAPDAFDAFLTGYMDGSITRTRDLLALLESTAGPEAAAWFEAQLTSDGRPEGDDRPAPDPPGG